ncbi:hypothetical protein [Streptomyces rishiriensis]|uniref:Integral membrane protein n=1 Tax=Streptomyces rishiriensis TaxID=68264 RepID=A0ABU0P2C3_STRRH|nr:hypothetical protein [Streptomyces rishiriensis]MDQ0585546.1 hypothetical protein [Streptomyces rishiriensis]
MHARVEDLRGRAHAGVAYLLRHGVSRRAWVVGSGAAYWLCALAGVWYLLRQGATPGHVFALHLVCLVFEALSVLGVLWPGAAAGSAQLVDDHQSVTVSAACLSGVVLIPPALFPLGALGRTGRPMEAVLGAASALLLASFAGLVAVTALAPSVRTSHEGAGPPDGPDWPDAADFDPGD